MFAFCGPMEAVRLKKGYAFVDFVNASGATPALAAPTPAGEM